jgi:hypothetical protein
VSKIIGEDRVTIEDDRARDAMEPDHHVEECSCHCRRRVQVAELDEVHGLQETVDDGEQHQLVIDTQESLNEVHAKVGPNRHGELELPKEICWLQVFNFVVLAHRAGVHEVLDGGVRTRYVEVSARSRCSVLTMPSWPPL